MKNNIKKLLAFLLAFVLSLQLSEAALATAAEEVRIALDPTSQIELSTPEDLSEGNWFFIRERQFEIGEKSEEKLYVPIQRAGDLSQAASVTLKLADITSHFGVNYEAEIFRVKQDPASELGDFSLVDAIHENQDSLEEVPELSEEEAAELIARQGEAEITDAAGNKLGTASVETGGEQPAAEGEEKPAAEGEKKPAPEGEEKPDAEGEEKPAAEGEKKPSEALTLIPEEVEPVAEEGAETPAEAKPAPGSNPLRAAHDAFTGTVSDRQPVESSVSWMSPALQEIYDKGDDSLPEVEPEEDLPNSIPGYTFTLDFAAGEDVKFLVVTPLYSEKADGDSSLLLTLEAPDGGFLLHEDFFTSYVDIKDEDVPEPVTVSFSQAEYTAADGKVILTVTRAGAINEIVTVMVSTYDGSALQGADYSGVGAKLYFPMGLESRTLEIPVGQSAEEKDFYVTLTPVSECTAGLGTARVVIPAAEQEAELMVSDAYLDDAFTSIESFGGATITGSGGVFSATDKYESVGLWFNNNWGRETYFYDGIQLTWSADVPRNFGGILKVISRTADGNGRDYTQKTIKVIDNNSFEGVLIGNSFSYETVEHYFGEAKNPWYYGVYTARIKTWGDFDWLYSPSTVTVHYLQPIKREFTFEVQPADPLNLRGVPADDESQMNGVYINSSLTDASVTVRGGDSFSLTAQNSSEFCRFVGIDAVAENGATYRIANAAPGTRTMNVTVTQSMINALADRGFINWSPNYGRDVNSMKGTIKIKPVFEKIPAKVVIGEGTYGGFEGFKSGEYDYYLGERITLKTELNERGQAAGARGSGVGYYKAESKTGLRLDQSNNSPYLNAERSKVFRIDQPFINIWPVFDTSGNAVIVQVSGKDLQYFDAARGILALDGDPAYNPETDVYSFIVSDDATVNHVMLMAAALKEQYGEYVPLWRDTRSSTQYSGAMFPFRVGTDREENVVRLSVSTNAVTVVSCAVSGTVQAQEINLATGRPGGRLSPAKNALVYYGSGSAVTDGKGAFTLPAARVAANTTVRYAVSYNGAMTICEMRAPSPARATAQDTLNIGVVEIPSFSTLGAHITDVYAIQDQHYMSDVKILEMNGQKTVLAARVSPGEGYMLDGETRQEKILGVTFFFLNPLTNELHGEFEAKYDAETDTWRVDLKEFKPDSPDLYSYGDVLYAQLTTDKQVAAAYDAEGGIAPDMVYDPVSTGYSVITDSDYVPTTFDYNMPVDAKSVFGPGGIIEQGGGDPELCDTPVGEAQLNGSSERTTYGEFPFIGELNFILNVTAVVGGNARARALADQMFALAELDSDDANLQGISDVLPEGQLRVGIAMKFGSLPYGGTRFVFALTFTMGNSLWDQNMSNPWQDTGAASRFFSTSSNSSNGNWRGAGMKRYANGTFGPAMFSISFAIGFYIDFGYLNITTTDGSGHSETRHQCVYLGGGGVAGFVGNLSTTAPLPSPIPMYAGIEVDASIMLFLGASKNPNLVLENFKEDKSLDGLDFGFQYQLTGSVTGKGVLGLGFDHALGLRGNLGLKIEMCYSPIFQQWFPNNSYFKNRPFSYGSSIVMSGYLDAVFMNIPLATFSYPLYYRGYLWLFNQMRIANRVVSYVQGGVNEMLDKGTGDPAVIRRCTALCDQILAKIERFENPQSEADELREYAFDKGVINHLEYITSFSAEIGGLLGTAIKLMDDEDAGTPAWSVQPHVDSKWVAGDSAELMAAFSPEPQSATVLENARKQTGARLLDIGDDRLLMVFLGDDGNRPEMQASVLQYAVYNTATGLWEIKPTTLQPDGTGDYMPDLCDADNDVIISWISTAPEKVPESDEDPTEHMNQMDVFTVRVPKSTLKTANGSINAADVYQLTNDVAYDTLPRAAYDSETKDVIVLYTKTMPDTDYQPGSITQKVLDYAVGGAKIYSVNAYMLYDASQGRWATDYFYPSESNFDTPEEEEEFIKEWGAQRIVRIEIDGQKDPAISEMTVSRGYNSLAVYAYTVDKNHDASSSDDKELYIQFYDFRNHKTYVPIRMTNDGVSQSMPTLTRSGGDTYLFWLEDSKALKYVDVSAMLKSTVCYDDKGEVTSPAVLPDGSFAEGYTLPIGTVDMTSLTGDDGVEGLTGYTVLSNRTTVNDKAYDDLYVIWTSGETYEVEMPGLRTGENRTETCKEIYAAAMIHEEDRTLGNTLDGDALAASWSKPYRLTKDHKYHDGVAAAINSKGDLYLMHSQFDMIWHGDDEDWISKNLVARTDQSGSTYYEGDCYEYTPTHLMMTRCTPVGSLEATQLLVSDETPMPGETVKVTAMLENTGLTTASGCQVKIYETKNGMRGRLLYSRTSDDKIVVNTSRRCTFDWTLPADLEGVGIECEVSELNPRGGYFSAVNTAHTPLKLATELSGEIGSITQKGDVFEAEIAVTNNGNIAAKQGTEAQLHLECLYGNAKEVYGVSDQALATVDLSNLAPGETRSETLTLNIPASVFDYCGYDAVTLRVFSPEHEELDESEQCFVCLDEPMGLKLGNGSDKRMSVGQSDALNVHYDLSAFRDENTDVVYTSEDPSVAMVLNDKLVAVGTGTTTLTATVLPFGTSTTVKVTVSDGAWTEEMPSTSEEQSVIVTADEIKAADDDSMFVTVSDVVVKLPAGALRTAVQEGKNAVVTVKKQSGGNVTVDVSVGGAALNENIKIQMPAAGRGQVLVIVKPDGTEEIVKKSVVSGSTVYAEIPAGSTVMLADKAKTFADVAANAWYAGAVDFASSHGLFQGTDKGFEPDAPMNRAMLATVLYRLEGAKATGKNPFADVADGTWYTDAVTWASGAGIVTGTGSGFEPDAPVTREQIAVMFFRYANYLGLDTGARTPLNGFRDGGKTSDWAADAMQWAVNVGLFQGNADGSLNPAAKATRAEVATLLERMVKLIVA